MFLGFLRQSTNSQTISLGPFRDFSDYSVEDVLTIANTDVDLIKNGAASVNKNSGGGTHRANGVYSFVLDSTDTDTAGNLRISINISGVYPIEGYAIVLTAAAYDFMFGTSSNPDAAVNLQCDTAISDASLATAASIAGLNDFDPTTDQVVVATNNDKTGYQISGTLTTLDALDTAQDSQHNDSQADIADLNTLVSAINTLVAAIKAKTDLLTFTVANQVDANMQSINDVTVTGNGQPGTEFGV